MQQSRMYLALAIMESHFASAMHYEFMAGKYKSNFFALLNTLPIGVRIDHLEMVKKYIHDINVLHSWKHIGPQLVAYTQFKVEHHIEGKTLDEMIDLSPELTEELVIERMIEDDLFLLFNADPEE